MNQGTNDTEYCHLLLPVNHILSVTRKITINTLDTINEQTNEEYLNVKND